MMTEVEGEEQYNVDAERLTARGASWDEATLDAILRDHVVAILWDAQGGLVRIVRGRNTNEFLNELTAFPHGNHDDCVDALAGAHSHLSTRNGNLGASSGYSTSPLHGVHREDVNRFTGF
jgi:phage terminase large subunit-like protein